MRLNQVLPGQPFRFQSGPKGVWVRLRSVDSNLTLAPITIAALEPVRPLDHFAKHFDAGDTLDASDHRDKRIRLMKSFVGLYGDGDESAEATVV